MLLRDFGIRAVLGRKEQCHETLVNLPGCSVRGCTGKSISRRSQQLPGWKVLQLRQREISLFQLRGSLEQPNPILLHEFQWLHGEVGLFHVRRYKLSGLLLFYLSYMLM
jgi:hypothetical protein